MSGLHNVDADLQRVFDDAWVRAFRLKGEARQAEQARAYNALIAAQRDRQAAGYNALVDARLARDSQLARGARNRFPEETREPEK